MKKMLVLMLSLLLMLAALTTAAMAQSVSLPPFEYFGEGIVFGQADEANNMYVYECADADVLIDAITLYAKVLSNYYDVTSFQMDDESSDTFSYFYFTEYTGDADLTPEAMDACPDPCYVMIAVGSTQDSFLAIVMGVDGITFDDVNLSRLDQPAYEPPIAGDDGLVIYAPEEYIDGVPECTVLSGQDNYYSYIYYDCGKRYDDEGNDEIWALFVQYVNDLVDSGYYEIISHEDDDLEELYGLRYIGPGTVNETFSVKTYQDDEYAIIINSLLGRTYVFISTDIMMHSLEEVMESKGYSTASSSSSNSSSGSSSYSSTSTRTKDCTRCDNGKVSCSQCGGRGYFEKRVSVPNYSGSGSKYETVKEDCSKCRGLKTQDCSACDGRGKVEY